jgi:MFS transporter, DHA1 family, tetracycline resistance protein
VFLFLRLVCFTSVSAWSSPPIRSSRSIRLTSLRTTMTLQNRHLAPKSSATTKSKNLSASLNAESVMSADNNERRRRERRISVGAILASCFLNLLGFTMASPITPALGKHFSLKMGASFGSLTSAYPLGMLIGLLFWPRLSDTIGRKRVITASLLGSGLGLAAQTWVIHRDMSLSWFLTARALTGAFAGSSPVSKAYLADVGYKDGKLPRYLALRDASSTMAYIAGPMLGGLLFELRRWLSNYGPYATDLMGTTGSLSFVIGSSAAASTAAALLVAAFVTDFKPSKQRAKGEVNSDNDSDSADGKEELISCPLGHTMWAGVASVCIISFLFNVGDSSFHAFYSQMQKSAGMSAGDIGFLYTILATISFSVSAGVTGPLMRSWGPVWTCALGLTFVGMGLSAMGIAAWGQVAAFPTSVGVLAAAAAVYYCGVPLYGPTIPTMLLRCVPSNKRGTIMGLDGTINTLARIVSPLVMGEIFRRYGAGAAFGVAGTMVFGGVFTTLLRRYVVLRQSYAK